MKRKTLLDHEFGADSRFVECRVVRDDSDLIVGINNINIFRNKRNGEGCLCAFANKCTIYIELYAVKRIETSAFGDDTYTIGLGVRRGKV